MKKNIFLTMLVLISMLNFSNVFAQPNTGGIPIQTTILDDDENGEDWWKYVNAQCKVKIKVPFYTTNLELDHLENEVVVIDGVPYFTFPENRPGMDLHYTIGDISGVAPILYFKSIGTAETADGDFIEVYVSYFEIIIDVADECAFPNEGGFSSISYEYALMTRPEPIFGGGNTTAIPYPICDYLSSDDIFACEVFDFCANQGTPLKGNSSNSRSEDWPPPCLEGNLHFQSGGYLLLCHSFCNSEPQSGFDSNRTNHDNRSIDDTKLIKKLSPNPFVSEISLSLEEDESNKIKFLGIYNSQGVSILTKTQMQLEGESEIFFDLAHLPAGIYFLKIISENSLETVKLVKQ